MTKSNKFIPCKDLDHIIKYGPTFFGKMVPTFHGMYVLYDDAASVINSLHRDTNRVIDRNTYALSSSHYSENKKLRDRITKLQTQLADEVNNNRTLQEVNKKQQEEVDLYKQSHTTLMKLLPLIANHDKYINDPQIIKVLQEYRDTVVNPVVQYAVEKLS